MIMKDWVLSAAENETQIGYAGEHLARRIWIVLDQPMPGWAWKLDVLLPSGVPAVLPLEQDGDRLYYEIDRAMLDQPGPMRCTLRGLNGEIVRKTNTVELLVSAAVRAVEHLPPLPLSEFAQMEARITQLKTETEQAAKNVQADAERAASAADNAQAGAESARADSESADDSARRAEEAAKRAEESAATAEWRPATTKTLGGMIVGDNLLVDKAGRVSVDTADEAEADNTRPITAAAVHTTIGNINVLLELI